MAYTKQTWANEDPTTPIDAARLGHIEDGIAAAATTADTASAAATAETTRATTAEALKVAKAGDTMSGDLAMGGHRVTGQADPVSAQDGATKAWTSAQITALINGAPGILDTLGEIATALQSDESAAAALAASVALKAPLASPALTGTPTVNGVPLGSGSTLTPTATKTAPYTASVNDLALMNVAGGATALTLPTAPADKAQVGYRAIGATSAVPLTVTAGGSDTIGLAGATSTPVTLPDETVTLQYQAASTRWLAVSNVKTQASLDAQYAVPKRFPEDLPVISTRGGSIENATLSNAVDTGHNSHMRVVLPNGCGTRVLLQYSNFYTGAEVISGSPATGRGGWDNPTPNPITVRCSIGTDDGTIYQGRWTFQRKSDGTTVRPRPDQLAAVIPPGDEMFAIVTIPGGLPAGTGVWVHTYMTVTSGQWMPLWNTTFLTRGEGVTQGTTQTDQTSAAPASWTSSTGAKAFWPLSVRALDPPPSTSRGPILVISDSRGAGTTYGIAKTLLADRNPYVHIGHSSEAAQNFLFFDAKSEYRDSVTAGGCRSALICHMTNDCANSPSLATLQGYAKELGRFARRRVPGKVVICTIAPFTDSTDVWTTLANQTLRATGSYGNGEAAKNLLNASLRTGAQLSTYFYRAPAWLPQVDYVFDYAAILEVDDGSAFKKWRVDLGGAATTDGLHDNATPGSTAVLNQLTPLMPYFD